MSERRPTTLAQLEAAGHRTRTVKDELRQNLIARLGEGGEAKADEDEEESSDEPEEEPATA